MQRSHRTLLAFAQKERHSGYALVLDSFFWMQDLRFRVICYVLQDLESHRRNQGRQRLEWYRTRTSPMSCGTARVRFALRPCSLDGDGVGVRLGHFFTLCQSAFASSVILQCGEISSARKRHDTTETTNHQREKETKKKKRRAPWKGGVRVYGIGIFGTGLLPLIDREFNILSTFYSFPCLQQTWPLVWMGRNGYPNGKQRILHAVESLMVP